MNFKKVVSVVLTAALLAGTASAGYRAEAAVLGDANGDGKLDVRDAAYIASALVNGKRLPDTADFNKDSTVNVRDAAAIAYYLVKGKSDIERAERMVKLVNAERARVGASPLRLNTDMIEMANVRAKEIVKSFAHDRPDGRSCFTIFDDFKMAYSAAGENIAAGYSSVDDTYGQWRESKGHYENMVSKSFDEIGIGYCYVPNSTYRYYWVQIFRKAR